MNNPNKEDNEGGSDIIEEIPNEWETENYLPYRVKKFNHRENVIKGKN
jgi:hypothetical protein